MKKKTLSVTIRPWHLWAVLIVLLISSGALTLARTAIWNLTTTWIALCVIGITGLGVSVLAGLSYRFLVRLWAQSQVDYYNLDVRARQHKILMEAEDDAFEHKTTAVAHRRGDY